MLYLHLLMAILAVWRITELFTQDRLTDTLRKKFTAYLWQCPRCMSVWAAIWATFMFVVFPWANWPFALAWIYLAHNDAVLAKRLLQRGRQLLIEAKDGIWKIQRNELNPVEVGHILTTLQGVPAPAISQTPA